MTDAPSRTAEIDAYLVAVERHLADLPEAIREDLMSDLDAHLAEVAADLDPGVALGDLLGSPEAYARELRETAEVPRERTGDRLRRGLRETAEPLTRRLRTWADKYAVSTGHADAAEMRERLRPGWWVIRGVLVALLFLYLLAVSQFNASGYYVFGSLLGTLLAVVVVLLGVWASMRIGAKSREWSPRKRWWTGLVGVGLAVYAAYGLLWPLTGFVPMSALETAAHDLDQEGSYVTDIQVYDENGDPVTGVYLFDQNGEPLWIGDPWSCEPEEEDPFATDHRATEDIEGTGFPETAGIDEEPDPDLGYLYPICGTPADGPTEPAPSEPPSEDPTPSGTATPSETAAPDDTATADEPTTPVETPTAEETTAE